MTVVTLINDLVLCKPRVWKSINTNYERGCGGGYESGWREKEEGMVLCVCTIKDQ